MHGPIARRGGGAVTRDLNDTMVFVKVVELGSFVAAARALRLPKTTVSRKVQDLEARLGAQLLHRTTRKLGLTEAGNVYYEHSQRVARDLQEAESAVSQLQGGPRGWLRVTAPSSFGVNWIAPQLSLHVNSTVPGLPGSRSKVLLLMRGDWSASRQAGKLQTGASQYCSLVLAKD